MDEEKPVERRCLGNGCNEILKDGSWFCPRCKKRLKEKQRQLSGLEQRILNFQSLNQGWIKRKKLQDTE